MTEILIFILILELVIVVILIIVLFIQTAIYKRYEQQAITDKKRISKWINQRLHQKGNIFPKINKGMNPEILLFVLESYERRFKDEHWNLLKTSISEDHLLSKARKDYQSPFWKKRNFSSRCFALCPMIQDEQKILKLISDPIFLVSSHAAVASSYLGLKEGTRMILHLMANYKEYPFYFYRDTLLHGRSPLVLNHVEEIAYEERNNLPLHLTCLKVLCGKEMTLTHPFLKEDLESNNEKIRAAAVKVYAYNLQKDSLLILLKCIDDLSKEVRREAAYGLGYFSSKESIEKLVHALNTDKEWSVRLQAAWSLKRMDKEGKKILDEQNSQINKSAFDIAQYALQFDW